MYPNTRDTGKIVWILGFVFRIARTTLDGRLGQPDLFPRSVTDTHQSSSLVTFLAVDGTFRSVFFLFPEAEKLPPDIFSGLRFDRRKGYGWPLVH